MYLWSFFIGAPGPNEMNKKRPTPPKKTHLKPYSNLVSVDITQKVQIIAKKHLLHREEEEEEEEEEGERDLV